MFHGNVFGEEPEELKNCNKNTHIIGYGMNPVCSPCGEGKYAKLRDNSEVPYYECATKCDDNDYCILEGEKGKDCVKTNDVYARGADGKCVENDPCASADGSCLTAGCGKVGDQCQQCGGNTPYSLTIKINGDYSNFCVSAPSSMDDYNCNDNDKTCVCKSGYYSERGANNPLNGTTSQHGCRKCANFDNYNYYITDEYNVCKECIGGQMANHETNECVCPENQEFDATKQKCVCVSGMGLNENNECETRGNGQITNSEGYLEKCGFGTVPNSPKDGCQECPMRTAANVDNSYCVTNCEGNGVGKLTQSDLAQCVVCSEQPNDNGGQMFEDNGICVPGCGSYQIAQNGSCVYCSGAENIYDTELNGCISTCNDEYDGDNKLVKRAYSFTFQTPNNERHSVCTKCGPYDDFRYQNCESCESNQWFDDTKNTGGHCQPCPKNFACNGKTKKRCPFGTTSGENEGVCRGLRIGNSNADKGFLYNVSGAAFDDKVVSESDYNNYDVERFEYSKCSNVNGYAESYAGSESYKQIYGEESRKYNGYKNMLQRDYSEYYAEGNNASVDFSNIVNGSSRDIRVCHQCKDIERVIDNMGCVCGQKGGNPTAGQIVDIVTEGGHGTVCQVCPQDPNGVNIGAEQAPHTCKPCSDNKGFLWDTSTNTFKCATCSGDTALYTDSNGMKWCLTYAELAKVADDANTYYQDKNVWTECSAGSCCMNGDKYECVQGTYSWKGMACSGAVGNCVACQNGKTTSGKGTVCNSSDETTCQSSVCNTYIDAKKFCIKDKQNQNWCFEIAAIPMSFEKMYHITNKEPEGN